MTSFSIPMLCASVYGQKQHDLLLNEFIQPFWDSSALKGVAGFFWTMRYGAGGEHLKLRLHGPERCAVETRQALAAALDRFVNSLPAGEVGQASQGLFPSIDPEDEEEGTRPDRFWRWTTFRPSPFVLGAEKLAQDPELVGLYAHAQSAIAEIVMREVSPRRLEASFATSRQSLFIRLLIASFAALKFSANEKEMYLRHHRDWLVRFLISKARSPEASPATILAPLRVRIATLGASVNAIRQRLADSNPAPEAHQLFNVWQLRLESFFNYVSTFRGNAAYDLDPYTRDYALLPLFKLLHGACNQFGLRLSNELYVYQLLLVAANEAES